jgi:hypothetical protein
MARRRKSSSIPKNKKGSFSAGVLLKSCPLGKLVLN